MLITLSMNFNFTPFRKTQNRPPAGIILRRRRLSYRGIVSFTHIRPVTHLKIGPLPVCKEKSKGSTHSHSYTIFHISCAYLCLSCVDVHLQLTRHPGAAGVRMILWRVCSQYAMVWHWSGRGNFVGFVGRHGRVRLGSCRVGAYRPGFRYIAAAAVVDRGSCGRRRLEPWHGLVHIHTGPAFWSGKRNCKTGKQITFLLYSR